MSEIEPDILTNEPLQSTTRCDICGDTIHKGDHAVNFRVSADKPQSVCEICVEEIWDSVKGEGLSANQSKN